MKNKSKFSFIFATCIILSIILFVYVIHQVKANQNNYNNIESMSNIYLSKIEEKGFLEDVDKINIEKEISKNFNNYLVEGTKTKVNSGEEVYLKIIIKAKNTFSKTIDSKQIYVTGKAK